MEAHADPILAELLTTADGPTFGRDIADRVGARRALVWLRGIANNDATSPLRVIAREADPDTWLVIVRDHPHPDPTWRNLLAAHRGSELVTVARRLAHPATICRRCYRNATTIATVAPGVLLTRIDDRSALLLAPYHHADLWVRFDTDPYPDPVTAMSSDTLEGPSAHDIARIETWSATAAAALAAAGPLPLRRTGELYAALQVAGYDPDSATTPEAWLYHRCGTLIAKHQL